MYYNLSIKDQLRRILSRNQDYVKINNINKSNKIIEDVCDGEIYAELLSSPDGKLIKSGKAYTFLLNSDGISVSLKSNLTIWPVYLVINELPIEKRFCIDNIIIAGTF